MASPLRVLFVEDREKDVELLVLELRRGGYDLVQERVDTPEAFAGAAFIQKPFTYDSVLRKVRGSAGRAESVAASGTRQTLRMPPAAPVCGEVHAPEAPRPGASPPAKGLDHGLHAPVVFETSLARPMRLRGSGPRRLTSSLFGLLALLAVRGVRDHPLTERKSSGLEGDGQ